MTNKQPTPQALADCPFCTNREFPPVLTEDKSGHVVICTACSALGPTRRSAPEAAAAWNNRANAAPVSCGMGVGCEEAGTCYASAHDEPERCPLYAGRPPEVGEDNKTDQRAQQMTELVSDMLWGGEHGWESATDEQFKELTKAARKRLSTTPSPAPAEGLKIMPPPAAIEDGDYLEGWIEGQRYLIENTTGKDLDESTPSLAPAEGLAAMVALDEELEAKHPGWMDGSAVPTDIHLIVKALQMDENDDTRQRGYELEGKLDRLFATPSPAPATDWAAEVAKAQEAGLDHSTMLNHLGAMVLDHVKYGAVPAPAEGLAERKQFPILHGGGATVDWQFLQDIAGRQIELNHGRQSLGTLARRGGLTWDEILAALRGERDLSDNRGEYENTLLVRQQEQAFVQTLAPDAITGAWRPMEAWEEHPTKDDIVLLLVDYSNGDNPLEDATIAWTIGSNNDHNVGPDEAEGWKFAGWSWSHDFYCEGRGQPIGWMPVDVDSRGNAPVSAPRGHGSLGEP